MEYEIKSQTQAGVEFNIINFIVGRIISGSPACVCDFISYSMRETSHICRRVTETSYLMRACGMQQRTVLALYRYHEYQTKTKRSKQPS